jgi:flagellar hook assembly protein FlgD
MAIILAGASLMLLLAGFGFNKTPTPAELGFHRAQIDDSGLIELTLDRIRQSIRTGRPQLIEQIFATDFVETSGGTFAGATSLGKGGLTRAAIPGYLREPRAAGLAIENIHIEGDMAAISANLTGRHTAPQPVDIQLEKVNGNWQVKSTTNLFSSLQNFPEVRVGGLGKSADESVFRLFSFDDEDDVTLQLRPLSGEYDIDKLTQRVTQENFERQLFDQPYAGVLFSSVTQLNSAPFFTSRYVQIVSDPAWNRLVYGDYDGWIKSFQGQLKSPHGIDRDAMGSIYVADTGNDRIVVLNLAGSGQSTILVESMSFGTGTLKHPYDVAWDGSGTPFDASDDIIWVADSDNHRILGYRRAGDQATLAYSFGKQGNGDGEFFEPRAIAVGKFDGRANGTLYVADTGNRRLVQLRMGEIGLSWSATYKLKEESQITSLDVDHWGNVYVSDRSYRQIQKFSDDLQLLDVLTGKDGSLVDPFNFHVVFGDVYLESEDRYYWSGYDQALTLERWSEVSGAERYQLGVDLQSFQLDLAGDLSGLVVSSRLTDHSELTLAVVDEATQTTVRQMALGWNIPGEKSMAWDRRDDQGVQVAPGYYRMRLTAESGYGEVTTIRETPRFYLPLYYWEDSGSDAYSDRHLAQGTRSTAAEATQSIATHPSEVIYRFTDLNPTVDYEISAEFYNEVGHYLKQRITVDGEILVADFETPAGAKTVDWVALPREFYADGTIELGFRKTSGEADAMVSQVWLREAHYDPASAPAFINSSAQVPDSYSLEQNYPNPFNPTTTIRFGIPAGVAQQTTLRVYNALGQVVRVLVNEQLDAGTHSIVWDGRDDFSRPVSTGVYFYKLTAGDFTQVRKLMLMK